MHLVWRATERFVESAFNTSQPSPQSNSAHMYIAQCSFFASVKCRQRSPFVRLVNKCYQVKEFVFRVYFGESAERDQRRRRKQPTPPVPAAHASILGRYSAAGPWLTFLSTPRYQRHSEISRTNCSVPRHCVAFTWLVDTLLFSVHSPSEKPQGALGTGNEIPWSILIAFFFQVFRVKRNIAL